ncbi:hypothetical protein SCLCIDRAFT_21768 [Scleroderma citrinum Foug A]|uniref:Myb/SANT-like domain-containing protein n=1 Tax=Scleroderma citrinum Foug A TaxID=1036808 RepID=A0A0C3EEB1_9AGAM|nr:hypothetical protein SCLCIDRAFT_21768 [Scleroderma citrinum Foug A]
MLNSDNSDHSLRSKGLVDPISPEASKRVNQQKAAAIWVAEEEQALVLYLQQHIAAAGDGVNFSKKTFSGASQHLKEKFPEQRGGEKMATTCHTKWTRLKEEYHTVVHLKTSTGASWSDETGAGKEKTDPEWISIIQHNKTALHFRSKEFPHFKLIDEMMPVKSKGEYVFRAGKRARPSVTKNMGGSSTSLNAASSGMPPPDSTPRTTMPPPPPQMSMPAPPPPQASAFSSTPFSAAQASSDVSAPPSVPSSFLSPSEQASGSSNLTSISRGKCKADAEAADSPAQSRKHSHGSSNVEVIKQILSDTMGDVTKALATPITITDICEEAVKILNEYVNEYTMDDFLELGMHLTENRAKAILFVRSPAMHHKALLDKSLTTIYGARERS